MNGLSGQACCRVHWAACLCSQGRRINPNFAAGLCPNVYQEMHAHRKGVGQTLYVESSLKKTGAVLSYKGKKFLTPKAGVTVLYPLWQLSHLCGDKECFQYSVMSRSPHTPLNHTSSLHTFTLNTPALHFLRSLGILTSSISSTPSEVTCFHISFSSVPASFFHRCDTFHRYFPSLLVT